MADPLASPEEVSNEHGLNLADLDGRRYDLVVGAVAHREYLDLGDHRLSALLAEGGTLADLKGMWRDRQLPAGTDRWTL